MKKQIYVIFMMNKILNINYFCIFEKKLSGGKSSEEKAKTVH